MKIISAYLNHPGERAEIAQGLFLSAISRFPEVTLMLIPGEPRPRFDEMLLMARKAECTGNIGKDWFGWINSDCQLLLPPNLLIIQYPCDVIGLRRIELGGGEKCGGVDGYLIKKDFYDRHLSDSPKMWVGGSHIDWWITRAAQKFGRYAELFCLAHIPHERSQTSIGSDSFGSENIQNFNEWADRVGVSKC